ncbi:MAG: hypothetical protein E6G30_08380 [Actinobacteria bacterium]|jgi:hypothetical protein|nr:MAG: hypothetical protein E6G30_08380 [Actinomycetota bacterium]
MEPHRPAIAQHEFEPGPGAALADLDAVVAEVGASYPLMAYAGDADPDQEAEAFDALILAGLVTP